jgi:O-antigen/teichoic acid export membrane protein
VSQPAVGNGRRRAAVTSIDQLLSSLSNALLLFTVAQTASVSEFGVISLLVAIFTLLVAFNRGALGSPVLLTSDLPPSDIRAESGYAVTWAALSGLVAAVALCTIGAVAGEFTVAMLFAAVLPAVLVQDILRFAAIAGARPILAVLSDGLWTVCIAGAFLANIVGATVPVAVAVALWGGSGVAAALLLAFTTGIAPRMHRLGAWWKSYADARIHFGFGDALSPVYTVAVLFAVTVIVDSAVAGSLRGAATLFGPLALLFAALPLVFVPHARRSLASPLRQWRLLMRISWVSSGLTALATVAVVAIPRSWGSAVMGSTWESAVTVIPFEGLSVVAAIWMASVYLLLKAQGRGRAAFWTRIMQVVAQLAGCVAGAFLFRTAVGIAASGAVLLWVAVVFSVLLAGRVAREGLPAQTSETPDADAPPIAESALEDRAWPVIDVLEHEVARSGRSSRGR